MSKHTPAPWIVGDADWSDRGFARYELEGILEINAPDARMIAAAPDLFDALRAVMDAFDIGQKAGPDSAIAKGRAAIAKAEGRT